MIQQSRPSRARHEPRGELLPSLPREVVLRPCVGLGHGPGTENKIKFLESRYALGIPLWNDDDKPNNDGEVGTTVVRGGKASELGKHLADIVELVHCDFDAPFEGDDY